MAGPGGVEPAQCAGQPSALYAVHDILRCPCRYVVLLYDRRRQSVGTEFKHPHEPCLLYIRVIRHAGAFQGFFMVFPSEYRPYGRRICFMAAAAGGASQDSGRHAVLVRIGRLRHKRHLCLCFHPDECRATPWHPGDKPDDRRLYPFT